MKNKLSYLSRSVSVIRWILRIWCLLMVTFIVILFLGEEVFNDSKGFHVSIPSLITGLCMLSGLIIAWKWDIIGGIVSLTGFIGIQIINVGNSRNLTMYIMFALPAILFILCGVIRHYLKDKTQE